MKLCCALLWFVLVIMAGCGSDSSCQHFQAHECLDSICCDPTCRSGDGISGEPCDYVAYGCDYFESSCMCGTDRLWHCLYANRDQAVPVLADMSHGNSD